jgi:hypothetical protein
MVMTPISGANGRCIDIDASEPAAYVPDVIASLLRPSSRHRPSV